MKKLALILLLLIITCIGFADTKKLYFMQGPSDNYRTVGPGFSNVAAVVAQADTRVAWNADPDCVYFDGSDDTASASASGLPAGNSARTVMAWVKAGSATMSHRFAVDYGKYASQNLFGLGFGLSALGADYIGIDIYNSQAGTAYTQAAAMASWRHYAIVLATGATKLEGFYALYIDGESKSLSYGGTTTLAPNTLVNGWSLSIGSAIGNNLFTGRVAEVAIFNRALSQSEIQSYYPYKFSGSESGLVRLYHMDEGTGSTLTDSISGVNATITGATWSTK